VAVSPTLRFRIAAPIAEHDRLVGALHELGTVGIEETESSAGAPVLEAYFEPGFSRARDLLGLADARRGIAIRGPETVPDADWDLEWRRGLAPRRIGPLWVRPSWLAAPGEPEVAIDPERAFGTGEHATTRLALALLLEGIEPGDTVLDVGTGSGILALGALRLGAARAVALDLDPVACRTAARNAERNELAVALFCGTPAALAPAARFDLVVANELQARLAPFVPRLARHARRALVLAGFLERERRLVEADLRAAGLVVDSQASESQGDDDWGGLRAVHAAARQASSRSLKVSSKA
jgi:ribosomal protein L11 methyltransferase